MTGYFVRRFLLIIPTFIGITMAVFLVMNFVPGGPVERQIMQYKMSLAQRGGARSMGRGAGTPGSVGCGASRMSWSSVVRACVPAAAKGCRRPEDAESGAVR